MSGPGELYVLHNCGLREGLIKIGLTTKTVGQRVAQLNTTGVPDKFIVLFSLSAGEIVVAQTSILGSLFANALLFRMRQPPNNACMIASMNTDISATASSSSWRPNMP